MLPLGCAAVVNQAWRGYLDDPIAPQGGGFAAQREQALSPQWIEPAPSHPPPLGRLLARPLPNKLPDIFLRRRTRFFLRRAQVEETDHLFPILKTQPPGDMR